MRMRLAALTLSVVVAAPLAARAQMETREGIALQNQIMELQHQVQELQQSGGGMAAPTPYQANPTSVAPVSGNNDLTAQLLDRVQTLEDQVRTLRGQVDELQNATQRQQEDLNKQVSDLNFQMQQGGHGVAPAAAAASGGGGSTLSPPAGNLSLSGNKASAPAAAPGGGARTADAIMQEGTAALARRDYAGAEAAAREVLGAGRSPRAYDAQFLMAQAKTGQHDYQAAAIAFDDTYNRNKIGARAQDSLLGLASSLNSLGEKKAACGALARLKTEFPHPRGDVRDAAASLRGRAGC